MKDGVGWTPLLLLCKNYRHDNLIHLVKLLVVENGADVTIKTPDQWNPLLLVCHHYGNDNLIEVVTCLDGIDVNDGDQDDWNPLHHLCRYYEHENLIDLILFLIEKGINLKSKTKEGYTMLNLLSQNAAASKMSKFIEIILTC